tara:strand:+ start:278 stop:502 length:225 start_codon:yes stop_codon:yes gene_type:complete
MNVNINLTFPEITMIASVATLFANNNINIFYTLFVVSIMSAFFKICLAEKRIEDIKEITSFKREDIEQVKYDSE